MKKNKIIIFGSNGMLGTYLYTYFKNNHYDVFGLNRYVLDIARTDICSIKDVISKYADSSKNNIIINCAGIIPQRNTSNTADIIKVNSWFPHALSEIVSKMQNVVLCHITTDCVFSGNKGNYIESDSHDEQTLYGRTKSIGEPENAMVLRTSIIGEEIHNKKSLLEWVKSKKQSDICGYKNHIWNGVTCLELAIQLQNLIDTNTVWSGVRHIFSEVSCSKFELIEWIDAIWELDLNIKPCSVHEIDRSMRSDYISPVRKSIKAQLYELKRYDLASQVSKLYNF